MIYEIEDQIIGKLESIRLVAPELAKEAMSRGGAKVNDAMRKAMKSKRHNRFVFRDGKGNLKMYWSKTKTKTLGDRENSSPASMANFITNFFDEKNNILVVGGMQKSAHAIKRQDGKIVGRSYLRGVGKHSYSILHKLDTGERNKEHYWHPKGKGNEPSMERIKFKPYWFKREGIRNSRGDFDNEITSKFEQQFKKIIMDTEGQKRKII